MSLDQRSEIEEFLLDTMAYVKDEMRKQKSIDQKRTKLPEISSVKSKSDLALRKPDKSMSDKLEFNSLDWEDREKILRVLFSKMNSGMTPNNWRSGILEKSTDSAINLMLNNTNSLELPRTHFDTIKE